MLKTLLSLTLASLAPGTVYHKPQVSYKPLNPELYELVPAPKVEHSVGDVYLVPDKLTLPKAQAECLAKNVYFEAAHQNVSRLSIAQVTMNRLETGKWGRNACSVVLAKRQFSWTHLTDHKVNDKVRWEASVSAAQAYLDGARVKGLENVLYYHLDSIPLRSWAKKMKVVFRDGGHLFFLEEKA